MEHEKIFKRENGQQVKATISLNLGNSWRPSVNWGLIVCIKEKGKRAWIHASHGMSEWEFRKLSMEEKREKEHDHRMTFISDAELLELKTELWMKLKP